MENKVKETKKLREFIIKDDEMIVYKDDNSGEYEKVYSEHNIFVTEESAVFLDEIIDKGCTTIRRPHEKYGSHDRFMF